MIPEPYAKRRTELTFDNVPYGIGGIELFELDAIAAGQTGFSTDAAGSDLADIELGSWSTDWLVIGKETACGDPIFLSLGRPHAVFTAMQDEGEWIPNLIAPSLARFWECLERFRQFAERRGNADELEENPPSDADIEAFLLDLLRLCDGVAETVEFWAIQAEIGMDDERWRTRLEHLFDTGEFPSD